MTGADALATFDFAAFFAAVDDARRDRDMGWHDLAGELWDQSAQLNAERGDHPICGGAVSRLGARGEASCQYALYLLRWLGRAPEEFLTGPVLDVADVRLPNPGLDSRLRWDLGQLHAALNAEKQRQGLTWAELAEQIGCTTARLTNLRTARACRRDARRRRVRANVPPGRGRADRPAGRRARRARPAGH